MSDRCPLGYLCEDTACFTSVCVDPPLHDVTGLTVTPDGITNNQLASIINYKCVDIQGKKVTLLIKPVGKPATVREINLLLGSGGRVKYKIIVIYKTGKTEKVSVSSFL